MSAHHALGPSGEHRWGECTKSPEMERPYPDSSSEFAAWGTVAHELTERKLSEPKATKLSEWIGKTVKRDGFDITVDEEMVSAVLDCVEYARELIGSDNNAFHVEVRVDLDKWIPGGFGTADLVVFDWKHETLHVVDWKFGKGVKVFAEENGQLMLYALGAWDNLYSAEEPRILLHVVQPRLGHFDTWEVE